MGNEPVPDVPSGKSIILKEVIHENLLSNGNGIYIMGNEPTASRILADELIQKENECDALRTELQQARIRLDEAELAIKILNEYIEKLKRGETK